MSEAESDAGLQNGSFEVIGFRQYESTVSPESAIKWMEFLLRFVEYTMRASESAVMSGGNTIEDLFCLISLP